MQTGTEEVEETDAHIDSYFPVDLELEDQAMSHSFPYTSDEHVQHFAETSLPNNRNKLDLQYEPLVSPHELPDSPENYSRNSHENEERDGQVYEGSVGSGSNPLSPVDGKQGSEQSRSPALHSNVRSPVENDLSESNLDLQSDINQPDSQHVSDYKFSNPEISLQRNDVDVSQSPGGSDADAPQSPGGSDADAPQSLGGSDADAPQSPGGSYADAPQSPVGSDNDGPQSPQGSDAEAPQSPARSDGDGDDGVYNSRGINADAPDSPEGNDIVHSLAASDADAPRSPEGNDSDAVHSPEEINADVPHSPEGTDGNAPESPGGINGEAPHSPAGSDADAPHSPAGSDADAAHSPAGSDADAPHSPAGIDADALHSPAGSDADAPLSPAGHDAEAPQSPEGIDADAPHSPGESDADALRSPKDFNACDAYSPINNDTYSPHIQVKNDAGEPYSPDRVGEIVQTSRENKTNLPHDNGHREIDDTALQGHDGMDSNAQQSHSEIIDNIPQNPDGDANAPLSPEEIAANERHSPFMNYVDNPSSPMGNEMDTPLSPDATDVAPFEKDMEDARQSPGDGDENELESPLKHDAAASQVHLEAKDDNPTQNLAEGDANPPLSPTGDDDNPPMSPAGSDVNPPMSPAGDDDNPPLSPAGSDANPPLSPAGDDDNPPMSPAGSDANPPIGQTGADDNPPLSPTGSDARSPRFPDDSSDAASDNEDEGTNAVNESSAEEENESDKESAAGDELIAHIFGSSDEEEEFEGFGADDVEKGKDQNKKLAEGEGNDIAGEGVLPHLSSDDEEVKKDREDFTSDFDMMMQRKKDENRKRRRKRRDVDLINDSDDLIVEMIRKMKDGADEDRRLNEEKKPAVQKLKMLPWVESQLKKSDLHVAFLDNGILTAVTEWLAPLPDKSLPHLKIRESLLRLLAEMPSVNADVLKTSGIGKAVMYLYKHPKEIRPNKEIAGKLINEWSRPIFNSTSNFKSLSREEREQRDYEHLPKKRKLSLESSNAPGRDMDKPFANNESTLKPGAKGWVPRARVPMPSAKDYVVRPKWNVEEKVKGSGKKGLNRFEKRFKEYKDQKRQSKSQRAVIVSIEGRKMSL